MAATIRTGHGASIAFTTSAFVASFRSIGSFSMARPEVDTSHLATVLYRTFIPGDLIDPGEFTCEFLYNADQQPPISGASETITISCPGPGGGIDPATIAGPGFVKSWDSPEMVTDSLMVASVTIKWGGTITFTDQESP